MGILEPEPEPGDRWRWAVLATVVGIALAVLNSRALRPVTFLVIGAIGMVLLALVIAALVRALR